jgi:hypothetical protein
MMSDYAFGLKTPRNFLQKAHREVARLEALEAGVADPVDIGARIRPRRRRHGTLRSPSDGAKHFELYEQPHFASTRILSRGSASTLNPPSWM